MPALLCWSCSDASTDQSNIEVRLSLVNPPAYSHQDAWQRWRSTATYWIYRCSLQHLRMDQDEKIGRRPITSHTRHQHCRRSFPSHGAIDPGSSASKDSIITNQRRCPSIQARGRTTIVTLELKSNFKCWAGRSAGTPRGYIRKVSLRGLSQEVYLQQFFPD